MQILDQVKRTLASAAKPGSVLVPVRVNIAVAEFVIQIPQAQFDIVDFVFPRRGRKIICQSAEQIFRCMAQLAHLQGIPALHFVFPADEAAGFLVKTDFLQNSAVYIHISHGKPVEDHHDVNIAVFMSLTAQPASLKAHIQQPLSESRPAVQNQISQVFVQIKHCYFTP